MTSNAASFSPKPESTRNLNSFGDDYFSNSQESSKSSASANRQYPTKSQNFFEEPTATNGHQNFAVAQKLTSPAPGELSYSSSNYQSSRYSQSSQESFAGTGHEHFNNEPIFASPGVKKTEKVGDIISGRIPGDHNPFENLRGEDGRKVHKGSIGAPSSSSSSSTSAANIGDGSNLVVSSVIKFSR